MPRTRTSRSQLISRAQRRKRVWGRDDSVATPLAGAGTAFDLLADFQTAAGILAPPPGVTVGGVLLDFNLVQTSARSSSTDGVTVGIIVTNEGTAAEVPRPTTDAHADWMWWQFIGAPGAAAGANESTFRAIGGPIRIRARRRMDELGMHLWMVVQPSGLTTYDWSHHSSTVLLMP
jgi:hypothetical protein